jgi:hypothetical protein
MKLNILFADGSQEVYETTVTDFVSAVNRVFINRVLVFGEKSEKRAYATNMIVKLEVVDE